MAERQNSNSFCSLADVLDKNYFKLAQQFLIMIGNYNHDLPQNQTFFNLQTQDYFVNSKLDVCWIYVCPRNANGEPSGRYAHFFEPKHLRLYTNKIDAFIDENLGRINLLRNEKGIFKYTISPETISPKTPRLANYENQKIADLLDVVKQLHSQLQNSKLNVDKQKKIMADLYDQFKDQRIAIEDQRKAIEDQRKAIEDQQKAIEDQRKAIEDQRKEIKDQQKIIDTLLEKNECCICMVNPRNSVFLPCGHFAVCVQCAEQLVQLNERECPICRNYFSKFQQCFK